MASGVLTAQMVLKVPLVLKGKTVWWDLRAPLVSRVLMVQLVKEAVMELMVYLATLAIQVSQGLKVNKV
jgi:hypothetical protein